PDAIDALNRVAAGDFHIEERMMLRCATDDPAMPEPAVCLNEVLLERAARHRLVRVGVRVNHESLAALNADGVIVATPTGSTAYALSAGGPIVSPSASVLVLVPVSPHMIFSRPFVLAPDDVVELTVDGESVEASLSLDGFVGCSITSGSKIEVRRHERPLRLVRLAGPGFIERLRTKLGLPSVEAWE
ncbi:MAG: NAD(+)/NADH kinase, partial [Actinomycetota bacterium]